MTMTNAHLSLDVKKGAVRVLDFPSGRGDTGGGMPEAAEQWRSNG